MTEAAATPYDVFVSYAAADRAWVWQWLLPRLKDAGLKVCTDQESFDVGVPQVKNIERAVEGSRHVLLVLTPAWMDSQWRHLEGMLTITADSAARLRKLLPLVLAPCQPPDYIAHLSYADFADEAGREGQLTRVIAAVRGDLSLSRIGPQLARLGSVPSAPFLVPFPHNPDFVGRDEDLAHLHAMIAGGSSPVGIRPTVLVGLGGIGKTQLAVEYAHARRGDYPGGVYWLNAINPLLGELAHLAEQLGLVGYDTPRDQAVQAVWEYLDARPDALVVFDNVVEPATLNLPVAPGLVPANLRCPTIFTTRQRDFPRNFQPFEVKVLPELAAMRLLLRARPEALEEHHPEWGQARALCAYLGWLPLALELAAAYLGTYPQVTVAGYLERLRVEGRLATIDDTEVTAADLPTRYHEIAALVRQDLAAQHRIAVQATLQTQWQRLEDDAARLLFRAAGQFPEASWISIDRLGVLTGVSAVSGPGRPSPLSQALRRLYKISLIEELTGDQLRLHPLVREFAASLGNDTLRREMVTRVLQNYEDFAALETQVAGRGIDSVIGDLRIGLRLGRDCGDEEIASRLQEIERPLDREAHILRDWKPDTQPMLFAQQMHKRAVELRATPLEVTTRRRLTPPGQLYLTLRWRASNESPELERTLSGHHEIVNAVAVTPDGRRAISTSNDRTLKVWDLASGQEERTLSGHAGWVNAVAVTPDGRRAISASQDCKLKVWDLATGQEERTLSGHNGKVNAVAVTPDGRRAMSASGDRTLKVWDLASGQQERTLAGHSDDVLAVAVMPDGQRVISASQDRTLKVWDLATGHEERTLGGHHGIVYAVAVTPDGRRAISTSNDRTLKVWDLATGQEERTIGYDDSVNAVAVTPDGQRAISASSDGTLKVWDLGSGKEIRTLAGHSGSVNAVAVTPDGRRAVSASSDATLAVWDISTEGVLSSSHSSQAKGLAPDLATNQEEHALSGHGGWVNAVAVTPDGQRAISASSDGTLKVWDLGSGKEIRTLAGHSGSVGAVAVTPDGQRALSASADHTLKIWDLATGQEERTIGHDDSVKAVLVTPDGRRAILAFSYYTLKVWDLDSGQVERTLCTHKHGVNAIAVTPDGQTVISASNDHTLKIWDLTSDREERTLRGHASDVKAVAITPDSQRVISASRDCTLRIWSLPSGQEERILSGHSSTVMAVAVTRDGRRVISASWDRTLKVWDLASGRALIAPFYLDASITCVAVALNGGATDAIAIVAGDTAGNVYCLEYVEPGQETQVTETKTEMQPDTLRAESSLEARKPRTEPESARPEVEAPNTEMSFLQRLTGVLRRHR